MRCKICTDTFKRPPQEMRSSRICSKCRKLPIDEQLKKIKEQKGKIKELQKKIDEATKYLEKIKKKTTKAKTTKAKTNYTDTKNKKLEKPSTIITKKEIDNIIHEEKYEKENQTELESVRKRIKIELESHPETLTKFEQIEKYIQLLPKNKIRNVLDYLETL